MRVRTIGLAVLVGVAGLVVGLTPGTAHADAACEHAGEWYPAGEEIWIEDGSGAYQVYRCTSRGWVWQATVDPLPM